MVVTGSALLTPSCTNPVEPLLMKVLPVYVFCDCRISVPDPPAVAAADAMFRSELPEITPLIVFWFPPTPPMVVTNGPATLLALRMMLLEMIELSGDAPLSDRAAPLVSTLMLPPPL